MATQHRLVRALVVGAFVAVLLSGVAGCAMHGGHWRPARCVPEVLEFLAWCAVYFGAHWARGCDSGGPRGYDLAA